MAVRDATLQDLDALLALEAACYPLEQAYSRFEYRYLLAQGRSVALVEEDAKGTIEGFVGAFHHRTWRAGHIVTVNVAPHARRRGTGAALMRACEARLAAIGMERIVLEVNVRNDAAIALYEALGYRRVQRLPGYYAAGYEDPDAWQYAKDLSATRTAARPS